MGVPATFTLASLSALLKGAEAAGQRVRAVVVNFPHNPTGFLPTRAEFEQLVELCRGAHGGDGCFLFCDEMYRDLEFEGLARRLPSARVLPRTTRMDSSSTNESSSCRTPDMAK